MSTLGKGKHTWYPGTVSGTIDEAIAQLDTLLADLGSQPISGENDPREGWQALQRFFAEIAGHPRLTNPWEEREEDG